MPAQPNGKVRISESYAARRPVPTRWRGAPSSLRKPDELEQ